MTAQYDYRLSDQDLIPTMDRISCHPPPVCPEQLWNLQSFLSKLQAAQAFNHGLIPFMSIRPLFSKASSLALRSIQPPLSLGLKWPEHEVDHSLPCSATVKNKELYCHSPKYIHGMHRETLPSSLLWAPSLGLT